MHIENIVVGKPIVPLWHLLAENEHEDYNEVTVHDDERYLPRLLVKYGFMKSTSEVRRNRPDLVTNLNHLDFIEIKIGKRWLWIVVGE